MKLTKEAREFIERNKIYNYIINPNGTIDVSAPIQIKTKQSKFPVKFGIVSNYFDCRDAQLTSLEGAPTYVGGYFSCSNNLLTSLEGAPTYVGGYFSCNYNELTSLHGVHNHIKEINGIFYCHTNPINNSMLGLLMIKGIYTIYFNYKIEHILNKYLRQGRAGVIGAQQELLDAGLDEFARL